MRKLIVAFILLSTLVTAQAPNKMSFQTVVRNSLGKLVVNKSIGVRLSILKTSSTGTAVYVETHSKTSNVNGLLTLEVGTGTVTSGTFATIDWSQGPYFLKTEMDVNGGTSYTITGVTEFVSVPYAKMADNANSVKTLSNGANVGDMNYWNGTTWVPLNIGTEGQTLTICGGKPTWTVGGVCPGMITALNCSSATNNGTLTATTDASSVTSVISYTGGNGGTHNGQVVTSTGVTGLTATLQASSFAKGNGSLTYTITGTPSASGIASFALNIGGLSCNLTRTIIEFASYGSNITDIDGNTYKTVFIGTQQWMGENLKTSKYNDGSSLPFINDNNTTNPITGAWYWYTYYNKDASYNSKYGKLYIWNAISTAMNGNKNICPTGWHMPTNSEWGILIDYLGGTAVAGGKMKEKGTTNWTTPNTDATNSSLFSVIPAGYGDYDLNYDGISIMSSFWSSTPNNSGSGSSLILYSGYGSVWLAESLCGNHKCASSVRCLRD